MKIQRYCRADVFDLVGGYKAWTRANLPVESGRQPASA